MAWTASSILGPVAAAATAPPINLPQTPAQRRREELRSQTLNDPSLGGFGPTSRSGLQQVGSSVNVPGGSSKPSFLQDPASVLNDAMLPYEELLSRIFAPSAPTNSIPPALARAYAAQANANAARTNQQVAAMQATAQLPARLADARARENALAPWSLSGLPTGLSYQDPMSLSTARNNSFDIQAMMLPRSYSGWTPTFPMF